MMTPTAIEAADSVESEIAKAPEWVVVTKSAGSPIMRMLQTLADQALIKVRSLGKTRETAGKRRAAHRDVAADPAVNKALQETLAANPQFRRKAPGGSGIQGQNQP